MANRKSLNEQIEAARVEVEQKENRLKELLGKQKEQEARERTHRLCKRGGKFEKLLPRLKELDDVQFDIFIEEILQIELAEKVIAELLAPEPTGAQNSADAPQTVAQANANTAPKPTDAEHNNTANANGKSPEAARPQTEANPAPKPTGTEHNNMANVNGRPTETSKPQMHTNPAPKPTSTEHNGGANNYGRPAETARPQTHGNPAPKQANTAYSNGANHGGKQPETTRTAG